MADPNELPPAHQHQKGIQGCIGCAVLLVGALVILMVIGTLSKDRSPAVSGTARTSDKPNPFIRTEEEKRAAKALADVTKQLPDLEVLDSSAEYSDYAFTITGTVRNNRSRAYSYVQMTFGVVDRSDTKVGTALTNIANLEPGQKWAFKAVCLCPNGRRFKLESLTGF